MRLNRFPAGLCFFAGCILLSGCSANFNPALTSALAIDTAGINGNIHGGRQPIAGARVYLYAAGTTGYGSASTSLLTASSVGAFPTAKDASNNYYVTSNAQGLFSLTGEYTCTTGSQVYIYAVGGDPGTGTPNSAVGLMAILGNCPASGTLAAQTPSVVVNEVSTVAAAYATAGFAADPTHIGSSGTPLALTGIANAFVNASNIFDISGAHGVIARANPAFGNGVAPQAEVNTLANALAACINSTGPGSTPCSNLFGNIKSGGSTGTTATDTAALAINIAHNPTTAVSTIFTNSAGIGTPFLPVLPVAPNDYTLVLTFYAGVLSFPSYLAIDASGSVWISNYSSAVTKYSNSGALLSGNNGYTGAGLNHSIYIAIDTTGNAWLANQTGGSISEFGPTGIPANSTGFKGNNDLDPAGIAFDASGNVWVSNSNKNTVSKLSPLGVEAVGSPFSATGLSAPWGLSIDGSGNVCVGNYNTNNLVKLTSAGAPAVGSPFTTGSYNTPRGVAIGTGGSAWVANFTDVSMTMVTPAGSGTNLTAGGLNHPADVVVDGLGNVWTANSNNNSVSKFSSAGVAITPGKGYTSPDLNVPYGIGIDGSGNVWITNANGDTLSEFIGAAAPTITPTVTAVIGNTIGARP